MPGRRTSRPRRTTSSGLRAAVLVAFVVWASVVPLTAAESAEQMYTAALAREQAVRSALMRADAPPSLHADVRSVVAAYQEVVRVYPRSGYSDNALWQAGTLSIDAFLRFGQPRDGTTGVRLLGLLVSEYPSSSLVKNVPAQLARVDDPTRLAAAPARIATITRIRRERLADAVRVTIELDREVAFHDERIPNPTRVFVDLPSTRPSAALMDRTLRFDGDRDLVRQIRIGRHPNNTTRVVLEAEGVWTYSVYPLYDPYRLVIDCVKSPSPLLVAESGAPERPSPPSPSTGNAAQSRQGQPGSSERPEGQPSDELRQPASAGTGLQTEPAQAAAPEPRQSPPANGSPAVPAPPPKSGESSRSTSAGSGPEALAAQSPPSTDAPPVVSAPPAAEHVPVPKAVGPPSRNADGGYSMARQLGLSVSRVVIDPGHGGHDPGAKGRSITEAELVLDIALRVEKLLQKTPDVEVILTRRADQFVPLQERTAIANREGADLFLSIHANASRNASASGIETYFLNFATNMSAASVAARENAASGHAMGSLPDILKTIALNNKLDESRDLATAVQTAMVQNLRKSNRSVKDLGVKQAPFVVLIGASMPSVLAEISFVTNAQEARLLRGTTYRQKIAEALVAAIVKYQSSLKSSPRVAQQ